MTEAVGWTAVAMALIAMVRGEWAGWTARKVARDKLEFDAKILTLQVESADCAADRAEMKTALSECVGQHAASEQDRAEMKGRLSVTETMLAALTAAQLKG